MNPDIHYSSWDSSSRRISCLPAHAAGLQSDHTRYMTIPLLNTSLVRRHRCIDLRHVMTAVLSFPAPPRILHAFSMQGAIIVASVAPTDHLPPSRRMHYESRPLSMSSSAPALSIPVHVTLYLAVRWRSLQYSSTAALGAAPSEFQLLNPISTSMPLWSLLLSWYYVSSLNMFRSLQIDSYSCRLFCSKPDSFE